jgi:hypothetical protein
VGEGGVKRGSGESQIPPTPPRSVTDTRYRSPTPGSHRGLRNGKKFFFPEKKSESAGRRVLDAVLTNDLRFTNGSASGVYHHHVFTVAYPTTFPFFENVCCVTLGVGAPSAVFRLDRMAPRSTGKKKTSEGKSPPNAAVVSLKRSDVRWSRWKKERTPACKGDDEFN